MCNHPKTIYSCNHAQIGEKAVRPCQAQRDFLAGKGGSSGPCDTVRSHPLSTVKQAFECAYCADKRAALDAKLTKARALIAEAKKSLGQKEGLAAAAAAPLTTEGPAQAGTKAEEAEAEAEVKDSADSDSAATVITWRGSSSEDDEDFEPELDSVRAFLKNKLAAEDAHLMMWSA